MPVTSGKVATAMRPAARATSLLIADAIPACLGPAAASTVAVSGATVIERPRPKTMTAGKIVGQ